MTNTTQVRERLQNWGRYWRDNDADFGRCLSLESRYTTHRHLDSMRETEYEQERVASRPPAPKMDDAIEVNEAWKRCTRDAKRLLKWSFCMGRLSDQTICNRCGITLDALPLRFARACREIGRILDTPNFADTIPPNNSSTSPDKDTPAQTENPTASDAVEPTPEEVQQVE